jgi:hypothetical protein
VVSRLSVFSAFMRSISAWVRHCERTCTGVAPARLGPSAAETERPQIHILEIHVAS